MNLTCNAQFWTPLRGQNLAFCTESNIHVYLLVKWMWWLTVIQALTLLAWLRWLDQFQGQNRCLSLEVFSIFSSVPYLLECSLSLQLSLISPNVLSVSPNTWNVLILFNCSLSLQVIVYGWVILSVPSVFCLLNCSLSS